MSARRTVVLAAGGTGGHVFPALAAAEALAARGVRVVMATDRRGRRFEGDVETATVAAANLSGGPLAKLKGLAKIALGVLQATSLLRRTRADVVVGFGGFPSLPTMLAAFLLGRPTVLHEQNAVLGRVNRRIAGRVGPIATAFPKVVGVPADQGRFVGNPVRPAIAAVGAADYLPPADDGPVNLLIFGGSQGARVLSDVTPAAIAGLSESLRRRVRVVQQSRPEDLERVAAAYAEAGIEADLKTFFDDMPARLAAAHLVVARAGASTVAELAVAGRPALLIPFAAAMDDHQTANAEALVAAGAAWRMSEAEATPESVAARLETALGDGEGLVAAARAARGVARPEAAAALADLIESVVSGAEQSARTVLRGLAA